MSQTSDLNNAEVIYDEDKISDGQHPKDTSPNTPPTNWTKAMKIYLNELDPRATKQGWVTTTTAATPAASLKILDPWGNNYRYRKGSNAQNPDFDLWSMGKDSKTNAATPSATDPLNADDIRNF
jgi:hypothetical protein